MKLGRAAIMLAAAAMAAAPAWAHGGRHHGGGHVRFGVVVGAPLVWHYPPPYYYYPRTVVVPSPPTYIERGPAPEAAPPAQAYWYYCRGADAYYPYVKHCPGGWERVLPQPPG
ncbi:MAG: hypothetical protein A3I01_10345 [Betaproteobacteria bacterium RIFCSPLOWO2_02_FULL_65_24]|nr:MAG: hypothetical protein A3I01_10345 [Betaproteobacteria bacterium RIFCSPLOWO2_02_FULL_65_24]